MYAIGIVAGGQKVSFLADRLPAHNESEEVWLTRMIEDSAKRGDDPFGVVFADGKEIAAIEFVRLPDGEPDGEPEQDDKKGDENVRG